MLNQRQTSNSSILIFIIIALWYAVTNFIWWHINTPNFPCYDSSGIHFLYIFTEYKSNNPLIIWIMQYLLLIFGRDNLDLLTICMNNVFVLISLYFIYKIGKEIDSKETGNIAMILFAMVPAVYGLSRQFGHKDFHIIAWIAANIFFLIKTNYFNDRKNSILYGITAGIGLLTKDTILIYILPPFFLITANVIFKYKSEIKKIINMFIALAAGSLVSGWVCFKPHAIQKIIYDPFSIAKPIFSENSLRIMTLGLYEELLSLPILIVFFAGLSYFIVQFNNKNKNIFLCIIFFSWSIIFLMPHYKMSQYLTGIIPSVIVISAVFLTHLKNYKMKRNIIKFIIIIGIIQYINFSYFPEYLLAKIHINIGNFQLMYYNTKTDNIMNFRVKERCAETTMLIKKIWEICPAVRYSVHVTNDFPVNNKVFRICMLLNDMKCDAEDIEVFRIRPEDEALIIAGNFSIDESLEWQRRMMRNHPQLVKIMKDNNISVSEYLNKYNKTLENIVYIMGFKFEIVKSFYFKDIINDDYKVTVYKKIKN